MRDSGSLGPARLGLSLSTQRPSPLFLPSAAAQLQRRGTRKKNAEGTGRSHLEQSHSSHTAAAAAERRRRRCVRHTGAALLILQDTWTLSDPSPPSSISRCCACSHTLTSPLLPLLSSFSPAVASFDVPALLASLPRCSTSLPPCRRRCNHRNRPSRLLRSRHDPRQRHHLRLFTSAQLLELRAPPLAGLQLPTEPPQLRPRTTA